MFVLDDVLVCSATDLALAATCEFALLRTLDERLGRPTSPAVRAADAMLERTADLGFAHEKRVLQRHLETFGPHVPGDPAGPAGGGSGRGVVVLESGGAPESVVDLQGAHERTLALLRDGADVVYQGLLFDGRFMGRPDFLVREPDGSYTVEDTKLARRAKVTALLQIAAYADQLGSAGIEVSPQVRLVLGDTSVSEHALADVLPVYRERRARLEALLDEHRAAGGPVRWDDPRYVACGRCDVCAVEVDAHRDVLLVAGLTTVQRTRLRAEVRGPDGSVVAGIRTIEELAASDREVLGISARTLATLRQQAQLQVEQHARSEAGGRVEADGTAAPAAEPLVRAVVIGPAALAALPAPDPGDIFFDFEGDPLWAALGSGEWGLEYLFGLVEGDTGDFRAFWAHDRAEEKQALLDFFAYVRERRAAHPGMHVYHYAPYEKTALGRLVGRYGVGETDLDDLLRHGVLVDLYSTVRQGIRVSQPSYSLKKLEPLYMGDDLRNAELATAADSITEYARACDLRDHGRTTEYREVLDLIAEYNAYDCRSTLGLRDWLLEQAAEHDIATGTTAVEAEPVAAEEPDPLSAALLAAATPTRDDGVRTYDQQAFAMLEAALGYHRREDKPFWWAHFDRLTAPPDEWAQTRDVLVADDVSVSRDWSKEGAQRSLHRELRITGKLATGSTIGPRASVWCIYDVPVPDGLEVPSGAVRQVSGSTVVLAVETDEQGRDVVVVSETLKRDLAPYDALPMAIAPGSPIRSAPLEEAIREIASDVVRRLGHTGEPDSRALTAHPGLDVLRRLPPQLKVDAPLPVVGEGPSAYISAITDAVLDLDRSYLAVQGPPGTGKTYVGARVIERLVKKGWRVGVVAPSHSAVEHLLDKVVEAGVPPYRVGKETRDDAPRTWTAIPTKKQAKFIAEHHSHGFVVGGTAWDFTNTKKVERGELDLLVIDEAGQFSLANTLAVSVAAHNLLLLGDPQQLPQVSQGSHPEPVDESALGWVAEGHDALPADRGYFLERSWRMHPELCAPVSRLSYDGALRPQETVTAARHLEGVRPGVHVVEVAHTGNSVESTEEAQEVVDQVRRFVGLPWTDGPGAEPRPLTDADILVVVAYNAQRALVERAVHAAGFRDVRVGTVDKFQGREAPVVIVSMAASDVAEVPRGMGFLLSRNRINVAVSRGQWAAVVVRSPRLTDYLPATPEDLCQLGAFIGLCAAGGDAPTGARGPSVL